MYRQRIHFFPKNMEGYGALMTVVDEYNKLAVEKGWAQATGWVPTVGEMEVVWEAEYTDLASIERENRETYADPDAMAVMMKIQSVEVHRPMRSELLEPAPSFG
jgi:hypothetical protein